MQLKIRRSQREGGVISKNVIFCLDALADFSAEEQLNITRYKLQNQVIYNSEASKAYLARSEAQRDGSLGGSLRSLALTAMAATKLNITISSLQRGQHIECKSLDELLGAEEAIMTACENLKGYLETAATFDGREVLFDFSTSGPQVIAHAPGLGPPAVTLSPAPQAAAPIPPPTVERTLEPTEDSYEPARPSAPNYEPAIQSASYEGEEGLSSGAQLALILGGMILLLVILSSISRAH